MAFYVGTRSKVGVNDRASEAFGAVVHYGLGVISCHCDNEGYKGV